MKSPLLLYSHLFSALHMPDSLGFSSRQRPEHPRPASTRLPNNRQHAARAAPSLHPTRFLPNKSPPSIPHPTLKRPSSRHPAPAPAIRSQQSVPSGNSRQLPAQAFTSRTRNTHKLPQAPLPPSERPAILRVPSSLQSTRQSSERAPSFPRQTLARIAAPTRPPPEIPNTARHPEIPKFLPTSLHPDSQPRHPETQKKRSRHCAGSAPNYLQVSTRSYLSRSESGSGSCSSPYC